MQRHIGQDLGGPQMQSFHVLSPWNRGTSYSPTPSYWCIHQPPRSPSQCPECWPQFSWIDSLLFSSLSHVWLFVTPWTAAGQDPLSFTISQGFLTLMSTEPSIFDLLNHSPWDWTQSPASPLSGGWVVSKANPLIMWLVLLVVGSSGDLS